MSELKDDKEINIGQILLKNGIITLFGEIEEEEILETIKKIIALNKFGVKEITLYLNSIGGRADDAFALIDVINQSKSKITIIGLGAIQSCGLLILMSGHKRLIGKNASILSHQYSWNSEGKYHELKACRVEEENTKDRMINHYLKYTKLSRKTIEKELLCDSDVWLTAKQCLKYNLADEIYK